MYLAKESGLGSLREAMLLMNIAQGKHLSSQTIGLMLLIWELVGTKD